MDTLKKILMWTGGIIIGLFVLMFGLSFIIFMFSSIKASSESRYWIDTGGTTYYTNSYEEKDGCVRFHDNTLNHEVKQCGFYSISDKGTE